MELPQIIQGGMGVGISNWKLARAVSKRGQLGIVSSTALDSVIVRRLQMGDSGGNVRRALAAFPDQGVAQDLIDRYFIEGGKSPNQSFVTKPMAGDRPSRKLQALIVAANFVEVFLAKEGHDGLVGVNFLHKIQAPLLPALYGAMLAGVDVVAVGAGIPLEIPSIIDGLCRSEAVEFTLHVIGSQSEHRLNFDPSKVLCEAFKPEKRPLFFPIVSSTTLASVMMKKCPGKVDGLIIEEPSAGGHNAPPRGATKLNDEGEPIYGKRDDVDLKTIKALGVPFWLAGSYGSPEMLAKAVEAGAQGIQLGTLFAFCHESGLRDDLKADIVTRCKTEKLEVFRDPRASPTGFPFQVLSVAETLSDPDVYADRCRQCDLGYLLEAYERPNGSLGWRCKAEDPKEYVRKGGLIEDTVGRKCLCNSLMANIGLAQIRKSEAADDAVEPFLVTCGKVLSEIEAVLGDGASSYKARDVISYCLA